MESNIQRELPGQILLEVAYVGNQGHELSRRRGRAQPESARPEAHGAGLAAQPAGRQSVLRDRQQRRPDPAAGEPRATAAPLSPVHRHRPAVSWRGHLELQLPASHWTEAALTRPAVRDSYTWAKNLDEGNNHQDSYDIGNDRSLTDIDLSHRFVFSYIYELPFGRNRHFGQGWSPWLNAIAGGWQFNGITVFQSGTTLALTASNTAGIFNPLTRPNNNGRSGKLDGPVDQRLDAYFDKSVYSSPPAFTFGNVSMRLPDIRNDGVRNFDLSIFKEFQAGENVTVQFRTEMLNAFNTPRFGVPNTTVTSSAFGVINSQANAPRQVQFGLKLLW